MNWLERIMTVPDMLLIAGAVPVGHREAPPGFIAFAIIWAILGIGSFLFFHFNRNAALKRRLWPKLIIITGILFGGFITVTLGPEQPLGLLILLPFLVLISYCNLRLTHFCDSCGRTVIQQPLTPRVQFCPHCGAKLP